MSIRGTAASAFAAIFAPIPGVQPWDELSKFIFGLYSEKVQKPRLLGKTFDHSVTATGGNFTLGDCELYVDINHPTNSCSVIKPSPKVPALTAKDAYAFAKSMLANKDIVEGGLKLEVMDNRGNPKAVSDYTDADKHNLALCLIAAKANGLHIANEAALPREIKFGRFKDALDAEYNAFLGVKEDPKNPAYKAAFDKLEEMGNEPSLGKKRGILTLPTGDMLNQERGGVDFMTNEDVEKVGKIQGEIAAIREKVRLNGFVTADLDKLPKNRDTGNPDLSMLINDDTKRQQTLIDLGVTDAEKDAAIQIANNRTGFPRDARLDIPFAGVIQERTCIDTKSKQAALAAQQLERLASDIDRLLKSGANPAEAKVAKDLGIIDRDSDITKKIQPVRKALNDLERNAAPGQTIDARHLLNAAEFQQWSKEISALFDAATVNQTVLEKGRALVTLHDYHKDTVPFHMNRLGLTPAAPAPAAAPAAGATPTSP